MRIDFTGLGGPVFTGRKRGVDARRRLGLDGLTGDETVDVIIPDDVYTITSSYFLGLFGPSIRSCGDRDIFLSRFNFKGPDYVLGNLDDWIERALREQNDLFGGLE